MPSTRRRRPLPSNATDLSECCCCCTGRRWRSGGLTVFDGADGALGLPVDGGGRRVRRERRLGQARVRRGGLGHRGAGAEQAFHELIMPHVGVLVDAAAERVAPRVVLRVQLADEPHVLLERGAAHRLVRPVDVGLGERALVLAPAERLRHRMLRDHRGPAGGIADAHSRCGAERGGGT